MNADSHTHLAGGNWLAGTGAEFTSLDPSTGKSIWRGNAAAIEEIDSAVDAARKASTSWGRNELHHRESVLRAFRRNLENRAEEFGSAVFLETGKPLWEARTEVSAMLGKIDLTIQAYSERKSPRVSESGGTVTATKYKPHGVVAVLGPFNLPGHLPNAHIAPALVAGNTVVFKPSEQTPNVGNILIQLWRDAGLPDGVINLVQGGAKTGELLVNHPQVDGVFFTGGISGGRAISRACAERPGKIVALELGGNNPLVVWEPCEVDPAVYLILNSAFITAGQRCTCARRLILPENKFGDAVLARLKQVAEKLLIGGPGQESDPFYGPLISEGAADVVLEAQANLLGRGAVALLESKRVSSGPGSAGRALVTPGILDVTAVEEREDREIFGPVLQVIRVESFSAAIAEANDTTFGLSSGLICHSRERFDEYYSSARAGIINWNKPITGASGAQPFGGTGDSGNHRPSGYFAVDYCAYPVASTESDNLSLPESMLPGIHW